jgi:hypothetical protein
MVSPKPRQPDSSFKQSSINQEQQSTTDRLAGHKSTKVFQEPASSLFKRSVSSKYNSAFKSNRTSAVKDSEVIDLEHAYNN